MTYSRTLYSLVARLWGWTTNWFGSKAALHRDGGVGPAWKVVPWIFVPANCATLLETRIAALPRAGTGEAMPTPKVTHLEEVVPWKYRSWDRKLEDLADGSTSH